jgi:DNA-binding beta-propeller fold protein YncE
MPIHPSSRERSAPRAARSHLALLACLGAAACGPRSDPGHDRAPGASASAAVAPSAPSADAAPAVRAQPTSYTRREGQALVRAPNEPALYLADEDHAALRRIALTPELTTLPPLPDPKDNHDAPKIHFGDATEVRVDLPGRPAQVFALADRVLVTVRDPGLLLVFSAGAEPKEIGRVALPADAWGLAVSPDGSTAYVSSAWTHKLSRVDLGALRVTWTVDVAREPRGVTVTADGARVFVSHLMGAELTRVDVAGEPKVTRAALPADPLNTLAGDKTVTASLGYAAILSPDGRRLFAARHALGAFWSWQGNGAIDVLSTVTNEPVAAVRGGRPFGTLSKEELQSGTPSWADHAGVIAVGDGELVQPRALVYREKTRHLLVASEGMSRLVELDATAIAPAAIVNRFYRLGGLAPPEPTKIQIPPHCGAPTGVALSADEDIAWVYCRTTDNLVAVRLTPDGDRAVHSEINYLERAAYHDKLSPWGPFAYAKLAVPPQPEDLALGRRLYFDATEPVVSGHMACAGCHPDGRDDGHVWREAEREGWPGKRSTFFAGPSLAITSEKVEPYGAARQTPMLAGRVDANGPYGWHGESATLPDRIRAGFGLHRNDRVMTDGATLRMRADPLVAYLRKGLVPPPREAREPTAEETEGKRVFSSAKAACTSCHIPATGFTDRNAVPLRGFKTLALFSDDGSRNYKVPSLLYVGGTPPYYHDGSAPTLEDLVDHDQDRMGRTSHLTPAERAALVAYLKTL